MDLFTIGFTQKTAEYFFSTLQDNTITHLIDIRRRPDSQLSAFAKQRDLPYFLKQLTNIEYIHYEFLAPSDEILSAYRKDKNWNKFSELYIDQIIERNILDKLDKSMFKNNRVVLLCSEHLPNKCHRRLIAEYFDTNWGNVHIHHLI